MTSFISALSIFVLALVSACFTLPITENPLSETSSPFYNDVTTDKLFGERTAFETSSIFDDATREPRMLEDVTQESGTSEDATREPRTFEDVTLESRMFEETTGEPRTLEDATREPRMLFDSITDVSSTTEGSFNQQGEMKDSSVVTVEPTTERAEFIPRDSETDSQNETEWTTESSHSKREFEDSDFTTDAEVRSSEKRFATVEPETSSVDLTTDIMSSFTSTSSAVAPELYTRDSSTTRKYTGLLADKEDQEEETEHNVEENKKSSGKHQQELEEQKDEESEKPRRKPQQKKVQRKNQQELEEQKDEESEKPQPKKVQRKNQQELEEHKDEDEEIEKPRRKPQPKKLQGQKQQQVEEQKGEDEESEKPQPKKLQGQKQQVEEHKDEQIENPQPELEELEKPRRKPTPKKPVHESDELTDEKPRPKHHHKKPHEKHESEEHKHDDEVVKAKKPKKPHGKHEHDSSEEEQVSGKHGKDEPKKESGEEKKLSGKHQKEEDKPEGDKQVEEERQPEKHEEDVEVVRPKYVIKKRPTTVRKLKIESDDGIQYPQAVYDQDAWKNIPKMPNDFAVLDETSDVVTALNKLDSLNTEESKLNQGKESSRAE